MKGRLVRPFAFRLWTPPEGLTYTWLSPGGRAAPFARMPPVPDFAALSARDTAARIASGKLTAEAATRACLDRIAAGEAVVGAWQYLDPDAAIAEARRRDRSSPSGPLHGVPIGVKDLIDTHDLPTGYGSPIYEGH